MSKSALKILNTAEKLFNEQGFVAVGVDVIRDQSGCSKTTMYTYYQNKNQLIKSVLTHRDAQFQKSLYAYVGDDQGQDAIDKIFDWHQAWFEQEDFRGCLFVRAVAELQYQDTDIIEISQQHKMMIKKLIRKNAEHFCDPEIMAEIIYTLLEGLIAIYSVERKSTLEDLSAKFKIIKQHIHQFS